MNDNNDNDDGICFLHKKEKRVVYLFRGLEVYW